VFAPRTGATAEDDGYLVTFVADEATGRSEVWVLDARHLDAEPVARLAVPTRVPTGFHATWVTRDEIRSQEASLSAGASA
jgi:carotenoid cleavage dioxygenase